MTSFFNTHRVKHLGNTTILGLGEIIRYNNRAKIKNENVAEHCFYVSTTVLKICLMYNIPDDIKLKALEFAAVHDLGECFLGDIPYDTKLENPDLTAILEAAELVSLEKNMPEFAGTYRSYLEEEREGTVAYLITKLADTVSVLQYSNRERDLGNNTADMISINDDSYERVYRLIQKLEDKLEEQTNAKFQR